MSVYPPARENEHAPLINEESRVPEFFHELRWPTWLGFILLLVPVSMLAICYPISIKNGRVTARDYTISASIDDGIARDIGSMLLALTALLVTAAAGFRYFLYATVLSTLPPKYTRANKAMLVTATFCTVMLLGVAGFNVSGPAGIPPHAVFALGAVISSTTFMGIGVYLDNIIVKLLPDSITWPLSPRILKVRIAIVFCACVGLVVIIIAGIIDLVDHSTSLSIASAGEVFFAASFLLYHGSFYAYFHTTTFHITSSLPNMPTAALVAQHRGMIL